MDARHVLIDFLTFIFFSPFSILVGLSTLWSRQLGFCIVLLVTLMLLPTTTGSVTSSPKVIQRIDFGSIFTDESKLILSKETLIHTYLIHLPRHGTLDDLPRCSKRTSFCSMINHTMDFIHSMHIDTMIYINHTVNSIHKLIPQTSLASLKTGRVQSALLSFVGNFFCGLFGWLR